ncbi:hypothetical protein B9479_001238 [Cryptococcus floricola]|uniref:AB hydrolase-1 domain-containing protein n=1 Tax=Cryptococcus floricola TaxID=2591691 RepID=A0A5D3B588_9TREE|nr:hypothetical protein B9479_001238 [Cryptococcus floricola]
MVTYIDIPSAPKRLAYILSTPGKRVATELDPSFPTIYLCHPPWTNGYFYYPQFDDSSLNQHYNLLAVDLPGHGPSRIKEPLEGEITWKRMSIILYEAFQALNVKKAHLLGNDMGALAPMYMALDHPEIAESLIMINPLGPPEPESVLVGFTDWFALQGELMESQDPDLLDILNTILVEFCTGQMSNWILRDICDGLADLAKAKLLCGEYAAYHRVFMALLTDRFAAPSAEQLSRMDFPTLIIENVIPGEEVDPDSGFDVWVDIVGKLNALSASRGKPPLAARHALVIESINQFNSTSRWTTMTHCRVLTPLLKDFIENTTSASVFAQTESHLGRCQPREPEYPPDLGDILDVLQGPSAASSSQGEMKTWADLVGEMQQGEGISNVYVEVEG